MEISTQLVYNPETGKPKGFGFVKFEDPRDAEDAIDQANGKVTVYHCPLTSDL